MGVWGVLFGVLLSFFFLLLLFSYMSKHCWFLDDEGFPEQRGKGFSVLLRAQKRTVSHLV